MSLKFDLRRFKGLLAEWDDWRFSVTALLYSRGVGELVEKKLNGEEPGEPTAQQQTTLKSCMGSLSKVSVETR